MRSAVPMMGVKTRLISAVTDNNQTANPKMPTATPHGRILSTRVTSERAEGKAVYADLCSVCHGATGDGGVGPALDDVAVTWPSCQDQIAWIRLGSDGWRAEFGDTYGATGKPIKGGMPAQAGNLLESEMAAVAAFERATCGGVEESTALAECGVTADTGQG